MSIIEVKDASNIIPANFLFCPIWIAAAVPRDSPYKIIFCSNIFFDINHFIAASTSLYKPAAVGLPGLELYPLHAIINILISSFSKALSFSILLSKLPAFPCKKSIVFFFIFFKWNHPLSVKLSEVLKFIVSNFSLNPYPVTLLLKSGWYKSFLW